MFYERAGTKRPQKGQGSHYDELQPYSTEQPYEDTTSDTDTATTITIPLEKIRDDGPQSSLVTQSAPHGAEGRRADHTSSTSSLLMCHEPITHERLRTVLLEVVKKHRSNVDDKWPDRFYEWPMYGPLLAHCPSRSSKSDISGAQETRGK